MLTKEKLMEITIEILDNDGGIEVASDDNYSEEAKYCYAFNNGVMCLYNKIKEELGGLG